MIDFPHSFNLFAPEQALAYSSLRPASAVPDGSPVRIKIPAIGVDALIEDASLTPEGRMDIPAGNKNVAWYKLGPKPGEKGSAVIGGHYGIKNGVKFVFYDLDKLEAGDRISVIDDKGTTFTFIVRKVGLLDRDADATEVFTSSDGVAHLNVITCEGIWDQAKGVYDQRRVVYTDLEYSASAAKATGDIFPRSLSLGMSGEDVSALQAILEKKGFLVMPAGAARGYFGGLTKAALVKYQTVAGLPATGYFGPLTKAKMMPR